MSFALSALKAGVMDNFQNTSGRYGHQPLGRPVARGRKEFDQLAVQADPGQSICWALMQTRARPCFTPQLLLELRQMQRWIRQEYKRRREGGESQIKYVVLGSDTEGVFNLGGDLGLFAKCIRAGDRGALKRYADLCIDVVYDAAVSMHLPVVTIALVQGDALGGGFEAALACNLIIAERSAKFGLPEVLFNLFPGMGAYNFLSRRLSTAQAEAIILSGRVYSAEEMEAMGIVDLVVDDGLGPDAVSDYVARNTRRHQAERAVYAARQLLHPVRFGDLRALAAIWVETALALGEPDLRRMERLARAQARRLLAAAPDLVAAG